MCIRMIADGRMSNKDELVMTSEMNLFYDKTYDKYVINLPIHNIKYVMTKEMYDTFEKILTDNVVKNITIDFSKQEVRPGV